MNAIRITLTMCIALSALACGDDEGDDDEHAFDTYAECYEHAFAERGTTNGAFAECDEAFEVTHADRDACVAYYADVDVDDEAIAAHCDDLF